MAGVMTFTTTIVDLSRLDPPTIVELLDYETILARKVARMVALFPDFDATVDSDPAIKVLQVAAYDELLLRQDFNERVVGRLVACATGATLDHIGAAIGIALFTGAQMGEPIDLTVAIIFCGLIQEFALS